MNVNYAGVLMTQNNNHPVDYLNVDSDTERENFRVRPPTPRPNVQNKEEEETVLKLETNDYESPNGHETSV